MERGALLHRMSPEVTHRDGRRSDGQPSLSGHCGHGPIFIEQRSVANDPGCVKTLRGITAPGVLSPVIVRRAKKRKNSSSARHYDQIRFRFRTAKVEILCRRGGRGDTVSV